MAMSGHRILSVVGQLGIEPLVQSSHQGKLGRLVGQLSAAFDLAIVNGDLSWLAGFKFCKRRHLLAVNLGRARKVAFQKLPTTWLEAPRRAKLTKTVDSGESLYAFSNGHC